MCREKVATWLHVAEARRAARTIRIAAKRTSAEGSGRLVGASDGCEAPAGAMSMGAVMTADELLAEVVAIGPAARGVGGNDAEDAAGTVATGDVAPSAARTGWLPAVADVAVGGVVAETGAAEVLLRAVVDPAEAPGVVAAGGVVVTAVVAGFVEVAVVVATAESPKDFEAGAVVATVDAPGPVVVVEVGVPVEAVVDAVEAPGVVAEAEAGATAPVAAIAELAAASIVAEVVGSPVVAAGEGGRATGAAVVPDDEAGAVAVDNGVGADAAVDATGDVTVEEVVVGVEAPAAVDDVPAEEDVGVEAPVVVEDIPVDVVEGPVVVEDVPADAVEAPVVVEDIPAEEVVGIEAPVVVEDVATEEVVGVDGLAGETVEAPAAGAVAARGATPEVRGDVRSDRGPGASVSRAVALGAAEVEAPAALMPNPVVAAGTLARSTRPTADSGFATAAEEERVAAGIGAEAA